MAGIKFTWFYNSIRIGLHEYNCPEHAFAQTGSYIHACYMPVTCIVTYIVSTSCRYHYGDVGVICSSKVSLYAVLSSKV